MHFLTSVLGLFFVYFVFCFHKIEKYKHRLLIGYSIVVAKIQVYIFSYTIFLSASIVKALISTTPALWKYENLHTFPLFHKLHHREMPSQNVCNTCCMIPRVQKRKNSVLIMNMIQQDPFGRDFLNYVRMSALIYSSYY